MTVSGGLQRGHAFVSDPTAQQFQYRRRYREGYNHMRGQSGVCITSKFQYRRRYREGYNDVDLVDGEYRVEEFQYRRRYREGYNHRRQKDGQG